MKAKWLLLVVCLAACGGTSQDEADTKPQPLDAKTDSTFIDTDSAGPDSPCVPICAGKECGDDGCGGTCGDDGTYLTCNEETWEYGPPCSEKLFDDEVCGSGEDVRPECGFCPSEADGVVCVFEEGEGIEAVNTRCECDNWSEAFLCTWIKPIPGQIHCQMDSDCPEGLCNGACHPHTHPYCTTNCTTHADCQEGAYCGYNISVNFWETVDDWPPHYAPRCVPVGFQTCETSCYPGHVFDGCPCETDADCNQGGWGFCIPARYGRMCSVSSCMPECMHNLACDDISGATPDPLFSCVDSNIIEGMPCRSNEECRYPWDPTDTDSDGHCVIQGDMGAFCVGSKYDWWNVEFAPAICPSGGDCAFLESKVIPQDFFECPWYHVEMEAATDCAVFNEHGTCLGERRCTEAGLTECDALNPTAEICDGVDNDCDNETDEGC